MASGKLLRRAQLDCQEMWASMEERKEEARRLQVVQQRLSDLRSKEEEMTCSWRCLYSDRRGDVGVESGEKARSREEIGRKTTKNLRF